MVGGLASERLLNSTMVSTNGPTRIDQVPAMPGDMALGGNGGVIFIPPQPAASIETFDRYSSENQACKSIFEWSRILVFWQTDSPGGGSGEVDLAKIGKRFPAIEQYGLR